MNRHYQISYFITLMAISLLSINIAVAKGPAAKVEVKGANPDFALQGQKILGMKINGSGFDQNSKIRFLVTGTKDDSQISVDQETVSSNADGTLLTVDIVVSGNATLIDYDIEVQTSSGRRGKGVTLFRVRTRDGEGKTNAECIVFTGDLETVPGSEVVEDCCPNAGPFPAYAMTLNMLYKDGITYQGQYDGQLFTKFSSNGPHKQSKVQFWSWDSDLDTPSVGDIFFEIDGGDVEFDRKNDFLTVSFTDEQPTLWLYDHWEADGTCCAIEAPVLPVSFELVRTSDLTYCE
jgi:hypothetical protein